MTKSLLQQVMLKESEKKQAKIDQDNIFDSDAMIEKINLGYTILRGPKHTQKKTFAPSTIVYGHGECPRYWYLAFNGATFEDNTDAYSAANMTAGTLSHDRIQSAMMNSGIAKTYINDKNEKTTEFKVIHNDPPIFGYGDAMLDFNGQSIVAEIKTMPNDGFEYKKASRKPKGGHLMQLLMYMKILKKDKGVLIYENKNNHELLTLPVQVNDEYRKWIDYAFDWMKQVRKAWIDRELPVKTYRSNSKICKGCPIQKACAEAETGVIKIKPLEGLSETL